MVRRPPATARATTAAARRIIVMLFVVGMAIALTELPPNDWSALLLADRFDLTTGRAGARLRRRRRSACSSGASSATS